MILAEVRDYLKQRGQCSLSDIALHFDTDADAVRGMLGIWIKKGKVEKRSATASSDKTLDISVDVAIPGNCDHK